MDHIPVASARPGGRIWSSDWILIWGLDWRQLGTVATIGPGLTGLPIGVISWSKPGTRTKWESDEPSCSSLHIGNCPDNPPGQSSQLLRVMLGIFGIPWYLTLYFFKSLVQMSRKGPSFNHHHSSSYCLEPSHGEFPTLRIASSSSSWFEFLAEIWQQNKSAKSSGCLNRNQIVPSFYY